MDVGNELHLIELARNITAETGYETSVQQTGGGCATLFVKDPAITERNGEPAYCLIAGPGWWVEEGPIGSTVEFAWGHDDGGDSIPEYADQTDTLDTVTAKICEWLRDSLPFYLS